jgi:hypothetical protein
MAQRTLLDADPAPVPILFKETGPADDRAVTGTVDGEDFTVMKDGTSDIDTFFLLISAFLVRLFNIDSQASVLK